MRNIRITELDIGNPPLHLPLKEEGVSFITTQTDYKAYTLLHPFKFPIRIKKKLFASLPLVMGR